MRRYGFDNGHGTSVDYGIRFLGFPEFQYGHEIIDSIPVSGRGETLTERTGVYTDTVITNELEFVCKNLSEYEYKVQEIRQWLMQTKRIVYADAEDRYYKVKKVDVEADARLYGVFGNITVVFTCHPSIFLADGDCSLNAISGDSIYNPFSVSHPIFKVRGEGVCRIAVNGKQVTVNVGQNVTVDTDLMISYREDGTISNTDITGEYKDLHLDHGDNNLTFSGGFSVEVIPGWRITL